MNTIQYNTEYSQKMLRIAEIMKVIAHPTRLQIIQLLKNEYQLSVSDIQNKLECGCEQSMLSHHLSKMKDKGILQSVKDGKYKYYTLADDSIIELIDCLDNSSLI